MAATAQTADLGWIELMTGLRVIWDRLKSDAEAAATAAAPYADPDPALTALLAVADTPSDSRYGRYAVANEAELRLAARMDRPTAAASFALYRARATGIGAQGIEAIAADFEAGKAEATDDGLKAMRAALLQLLMATHIRFADRRRNRSAREKASRRLFGTSLGGVIGPLAAVALIFLAARLLAATGWCQGCQGVTFFTLTGKYHLMALLYVGVLGAIFSRLIAFQSLEGELTYTDLDRNYSWMVILLRLFVGGIAAFVVYYLVVGNVLGGDLFPPLPQGNLGPLWTSTQVVSEPKVTYTMPTEGFAKMVVWCFVAGFSERFIPDRLAQVETKAEVRSNG